MEAFQHGEPLQHRVQKSRSEAISGAEEAEACGLGMTDQTPWALPLRVTTLGTVATYLIDRWV